MMQDCFGNATGKFGGKHCAGSDFTAWGEMVDDKVKAWLATPQAKKSGHAAFISACYFHCGSNPTFGVVKCAKLSACATRYGIGLFYDYLLLTLRCAASETTATASPARRPSHSGWTIQRPTCGTRSSPGTTLRDAVHATPQAQKSGRMVAACRRSRRQTRDAVQ